MGGGWRKRLADDCSSNRGRQPMDSSRGQRLARSTDRGKRNHLVLARLLLLRLRLLLFFLLFFEIVQHLCNPRSQGGLLRQEESQALRLDAFFAASNSTIHTILTASESLAAWRIFKSCSRFVTLKLHFFTFPMLAGIVPGGERCKGILNHG